MKRQKNRKSGKNELDMAFCRIYHRAHLVSQERNYSDEQVGAGLVQFSQSDQLTVLLVSRIESAGGFWGSFFLTLKHQ